MKKNTTLDISSDVWIIQAFYKDVIHLEVLFVFLKVFFRSQG
jgi:hypothetical protein